MFLGLDAGTQSLKAVVADDGLRILGRGARGYRPRYPAPGRAEQDPAVWLASLRPAIAAALAESGAGPKDVRALAVTGQLDGCVACDARGRALGPAILWSDRRATAQAAMVDPGLVHARSGLVPDATHMAAKIRWCIDILGLRPACWHQPVSFIVACLTGSRLMDHSLASTTMLCRPEVAAWDPPLAAAFGIDPASLPGIASAGSVAGTLTAAGSRLTGLPPGVPVAVGTGDDFANLLGSGICAPGIAGVALGTGEAISALSVRPLRDPMRLVETHAFPTGHADLGNPGWLSGGAISWFRRTFSVATPAGVSALAAGVPAGAGGLLFLPALSGALAPAWAPGARGCFYGATPAHGKAHFARALLEGCAHAMRDVVEALGRLGVDCGRVRLTGGGARSEVWARIRAGVLGRPVEVLAEPDAAATGAAALALVAAGDAADVAAAVARLPLELRDVAPLAQDIAAQDEAWHRYRALFAALEPLFT